MTLLSEGEDICDTVVLVYSIVRNMLRSMSAVVKTFIQ
jgi:hypothetical protein